MQVERQDSFQKLVREETFVVNDSTGEDRSEGSGSGPARDVVAEFSDDEDGVSMADFERFAPPRPPPYGWTRGGLRAARPRMIAALVVLVVLSVLFAVVGTQTFWSTRLTWKGWYTLYVLVVMLAALVLDLWDVSLTFFVTNTALLLARVITLNDALAGFSNEGVLSTAIMFIIARAIEKTKVLEWVVRVVLRRPRSVRSALTRMLPAVAFWSCCKSI